MPQDQCKACGCTDDKACKGGCSWIAKNKCDACFKKCHNCGKIKPKKEMYHIQLGFGVIWKCRDRDNCK